MLKLITTIWKKSKENPLVAFLGMVFLSCIGYLITYYSTQHKDTEEYESYYVKYKISLAEYDRIDSTFGLWKATLRKIDSTSNFQKQLDKKQAKEITKKEISDFLSSLAENRSSLTDIIVLLENAHYQNQIYLDISNDILDDAIFLDTFYKTRVESIIQFFESGTKYNFTNTFEGMRRFMQIDNRIGEIEKSIDGEIDKNNSLLRAAKSYEGSSKFKNNLTIIAWSYSSMFIGGLIGLLIRVRRRGNINEIKKE